MRYVFYALAMAALGLIWINTSERGQSIKRHLTAHPIDPRWSH